MKYSIKEFKEEYLKSAVEVFLNNYQGEKEKNILLPSEILNEPKCILNSLKPQFGNPGVAVFKEYNMDIHPFSFKISELFKMDYSAVSRTTKRFEQKSKVNDKIKESLQKVIAVLKKI